MAQGPNSAFRAKLYGLRNLLQLREAVGAYDASFTVVEKGLDVSQLLQRKLEIKQSAREVKRDLESEIKAICESLIQAAILEIKKSFSAGPETAAATFAEVEAVMSEYLQNASTRNVLLKPVRAALDEMSKETLATSDEHSHQT
jgi:uncharacterized protein YdeI (YjbR/CyaY-like superfamily)